jgi:hypothetical protein
MGPLIEQLSKHLAFEGFGWFPSVIRLTVERGPMNQVMQSAVLAAFSADPKWDPQVFAIRFV